MSILRPVQPKFLFAVLLSIVIVATLNAPASAASPSTTATSDLIPGPPPGSWTVDTRYTGPMPFNDWYGSPTNVDPGFSDAYRETWYQPKVEVHDNLAHYNSEVCAGNALNRQFVSAQTTHSATRPGTGHILRSTSLRSISGFGGGAFEVTFPADTDGYQSDEIYFAVGDYLAWVGIEADGAIARDMLLDQLSRQFASLPASAAELPSICNGTTAAVVGVALITSTSRGLVLVAAIVTVAVIVFFVGLLLRRRA
jgi:hypothetical protein